MLQKKEAPAGCSQGQGPAQCVPDKDDFAIECPKLQDFCDDVIKDTGREIVSASKYKTKFDNQPERVKKPLLFIVGEKHEVRKTKDGQLFSPATIKENKTRSSENVELVHFSVFDLDHKKQKELINISDCVKGFMIATAEDQAPLDAATMARTTTVYYPTREKNTFAGDALTNLRPNLCKIPPQYIHWFLNQELETFESFFKDLRDRLCEQIRGSQNDFRIATVTAEFGLGFHLLSSFLVDRGIWSAQESVQRQNDFEVILKKHVVTTASAATDEQGCHIFLRVLSSLLISGEVKIQGVDLLDTDVLEEHDGGYLNGNSKPIGFCKSGDAHKGTVYIDPEMAVNQVQKFLRSEGNEIGFSKQTLGQQLRSEGFFSKDTGDRNVLKVRWNKSQGYYWPLKTDSMGLDVPSTPSSAKSEDSDSSQTQSTELVLDSEGLL